MDDKIFLEWVDFHKDVVVLRDKIRESGEYSKIVAVSRGGLIPTGLLAYMLGIRDVAVVNVSSYFEGGKHLKIEKIDDWERAGKVDEKTLVVDDLVDSGQTFSVMKKFFPKAKFVSVYTKPEGRGVADIYVKELPDRWVVFPWDEF